MGTITGPGVSWWDSFDTLLDPSNYNGLKKRYGL